MPCNTGSERGRSTPHERIERAQMTERILQLMPRVAMRHAVAWWLDGRLKITGRLFRNRFEIAFGLLAACVVASCTGGPTVPDDAEPIPFEEIEGASRTTSGFQDPARMVFRDHVAFQGFWVVLEHGHEPKTEPPANFYDPIMVIAAAMGSRASGGYTITIEGMYLKDKRLYVVVHERSPGPDCVVTQSATQPVTAVQFDIDYERLPPNEIVFVERQTTVWCVS